MSSNSSVLAGRPRSKMTGGEKAALTLRQVFIYAFLIIVTALCLFPIYILLVNMTRSDGQIQTSFSFWFGSSFWANFQNLRANTNLPIFKAMGNSLLIATLSAVLCTYFSSLTAFAFQVYQFKGKKAIFTSILMIMMIPTQVSALGLYTILFQIHALNQFFPLIIPSIASPIVVFFMKQYLESTLPFEMVEAARVDGASEFRIFNQIVLPIMKPALAVQFIFSFVGSWNNYFFPSLILDSNDTKTIPLIIAGLKASSPDMFHLGQIYCLLAFSILPLVIVYFIFSKFIISGVTLGSVKG